MSKIFVMAEVEVYDALEEIDDLSLLIEIKKRGKEENGKRLHFFLKELVGLNHCATKEDIIERIKTS